MLCFCRNYVVTLIILNCLIERSYIVILVHYITSYAVYIVPLLKQYTVQYSFSWKLYSQKIIYIC